MTPKKSFTKPQS